MASKQTGPRALVGRSGVKTTNVLLVVTRDEMRATLKDHIESDPEFVISDEAASISDATEQLGRSVADVAVVATELSDGTALDFLRLCEEQGFDLPSIIVSSSPVIDPQTLATAGAAAHLYLDIRGFNLTDLIRTYR